MMMRTTEGIDQGAFAEAQGREELAQICRPIARCGQPAYRERMLRDGASRAFLIVRSGRTSRSEAEGALLAAADENGTPPANAKAIVAREFARGINIPPGAPSIPEAPQKPTGGPAEPKTDGRLTNAHEENGKAEALLQPDPGAAHEAGAFSRHAQQLCGNGYSPIPIKPGTKRPLTNGWSAHCETPLTGAEIVRLSRQHPDAGLGVACGYQDVICIDTDSGNEEIGEAVRAALKAYIGGGAPVKRGARGFGLFLRAPHITAKIIIKLNTKTRMSDGSEKPDKVEFLTKGQQAVIPPSAHPDTGKTYEWLTPHTLENTPVEDLPEAAPDLVEALRAALSPWMERADEPPGKSEPERRAIHGVLPPEMRHRYEAWARSALQGECLKTAATTEGGGAKGGRNSQVFSSASALGKCVHHGILPEGEATAALLDACQRNGLLGEDGRRACLKSIESGFKAALNDPLPDFPDRPRSTAGGGSERRKAGAEGGDSAQGGEWPEPKPIRGELYPVPAFGPSASLPEPLRAFVMDEADRMPCSPEFVATAVLTALGSLIGARCAIKPKSKDDWVVVPNLWGAIVAPPSTKKTPAISAAMRPLGRQIKEAIEKHGKDLAEYESLAEVHAAGKDALRGKLKAALKGDDAADAASFKRRLREHRNEAPLRPILRRFKTNDTSVEKLGELLRDNPAGVMVLRDELVGLVASWDRDGREGDRQFYLEGWNGSNSFDTDRIGRGSIFIPNLCVSVFGGIQPDKLTAYLEEAAHALANDGMLQRFQLLVYPDPAPWEWRDRVPNQEARKKVFAVFDALAEFDPVIWGANPADDFVKFPHFCFDEKAQRVFIEWTRELHLEKLPKEDNPLIVQHLAKYEKLFPALALIFHLVDCAANGGRGPVGEDAALRAAAWCQYLEAHARRSYGLLADGGLRAAQTLAQKIQRGKFADGFTARDVRRNQWRHLTTDDMVRAALEWLEGEGWLRSRPAGAGGQGGRPTLAYSINPAVPKSGGGGGS